MIAAPHSPMVEAARLAICESLDVNPVTHSYVYLAEAALTAVHAEEMRSMIGKLTNQLKAVDPRYSSDDAIIAEAEALLAKLDAAS